MNHPEAGPERNSDADPAVDGDETQHAAAVSGEDETQDAAAVSGEDETQDAGASEAEDDPSQDLSGADDAAASEDDASEDDGDPSDDGSVSEEELPPLVAVLEAALFASAEPVPITRLTRVLGAWTRKQVLAGLAELGERQEREGAGVRVVETAGGFQLRSVAEYAPWVRRFFTEKPPRLSRAVLETLAIVAYRQPVTRGEVEAVRGVNCDAVLGALTARGLIQVVGRRQSPGRPAEYGTTQEFLELFSLRELAELPPLPDAASLASLIEEAQDSEEYADGEDGSRDEEGDAGEEGHRDAGPAVEEAADGVGGAGAGHESDDVAREAGGDVDAADGEAPEDPEPGGNRLAESRGGADPGGAGPGEREGDPRAGGEG